MDHSRSPPPQTWLPSARPQGTSSRLNAFRPFSPTQTTSSSIRSPPQSMPMNSSTHLLQDLEPRTYDSPSDAESVPSAYRDSPPTPTADGSPEQIRNGKGRKASLPTRNITPRSKARWARMQRMQAYTDDNSEDEQHELDPSPQPISRRRSGEDDELPRWATSTEAGRIGLEEDEVHESMQPEWMRSSTLPAPSRKNEVKFEIPPPITASLMLPPTFGADRSGKSNGEQSILSSIFGGFPGGGRSEGRGESSIGRNRTSRLGEEWADIVRQEMVLQGRIQELLDLQASGLQRTPDEGNRHPRERPSRSSTRSRSDLSESSMRSVSLRSSTTLNGRHPPNSKRALHTARMELLKAMYTLCNLAVAKGAVLMETSQTLEEAHRQLLSWQRKLEVVGENLRQINEDERQDSSEALDRQIGNVEREIEELERKLKEKEEERRRLMKRRIESRSVKEAEAAKWVELKREVDRDVGRWLRDPNVAGDMLDSNDHWAEFLKLKPSRRNLEVAIEGLSGAIRGVKKRVAGAQAELAACDRGAGLWSECLELIMNSEKALKDFLQRNVSLKEDLGQEMVGLMEYTERRLEERLRIAENERWNLVVCVMGAEIEAWREGVDVLRQMTGGSSSSRQKTSWRNAKDDDLQPEPTASHSDDEDTRPSRHSTNTNSTEDPMWGSGLDNDAQILEDLSSALPPSSQGSKLLQKETIQVITPTVDRRPSQQSDGVEDDHIIHTEGLKISPGHSPWLNSSPNKIKGSSSPDREVSFRTAMEYSVQVEEEHDNVDACEDETKDKQSVEMKKEEKDESEGEVLTPREQRLPPHLRKGPKLDDAKEEESDGEVPADLLG